MLAELLQKITEDIDFDNYVNDVHKNFKEEKKSLLRDLKRVDRDIVDIELGGSYGKGTPNEESDIDYVIVYKGNKDLYELADSLRPLETKNGLVDIVIRKVK